MPVPQIQMPNVAAQFLALQQAGDRTEAAEGATQNKALLEILKFKQKEIETQKKDRAEAYDYALNVLSSVNSEEDMQIAKKILLAKYPETAQGIEQMLPYYDPRIVKFMRNSLRTETEKLKLEASQSEIKGYGAGTQLFRGTEKVGEVPFAPQKEDFEVFQGPDGNQTYVRKGDPIPSGFTKVQAKGTQVNVNTGDLTRGTKTEIEKGIIEGEKNIRSFQETRKLFKPEYLTLFGKGDRMTAGVMDKMGIASGEQKKLIRERAKWFRQAKADFLAYRKWATGVAGGVEELKEIAKAFPDPENNSPEEYQANLDSIEETTRRVMELNKDFLSLGIDAGKSQGSGSGKVTVIQFDAQGNRIK